MTILAQDTPDAPARPTVGAVVPWLALGARLVLAGMFVGAAIPKALAADAFAVAVDSYQLLPPGPTVVLAAALPWVEGVMGLCLLVGGWTRANALLATLLVIVCVAASASAVVRDLSIPCACFSLDDQTAVTWPQVALHACLLIPLFLLLITGGGRMALETRFRRESA